MARVRTVPPLLSGLVEPVLAVRRVWYRLRYPRLTMGTGVRIAGRLQLHEGTTLILGDRVRILQNVIINGGGTVTVGSDTLLNGCWIGSRQSVEVGDWCLISDCSIVDTDYHNLPPTQRHQKLSAKAEAPIRIGNNVWVGAQASVLKGTTIGSDSVIGFGAVVRGVVPDGVVLTGNPAQVVKTFTAEERAFRD